jgi:hypothetical protein
MTQILNFIGEITLKLFVTVLGFTILLGIAVALSTIF